MGTYPEDPALARLRQSAQHVYLACVLLVAAAAVVALPEIHGSVAFWSGCTLAVLATAATMVMALRPVPHVCWLAIPIADLVVLGLLRADLAPTLAAVAILAAIPAIWIGADFGPLGVAVAAAFGIAYAVVPGLASDPAPTSVVDWTRIMLWLLQTAGFALLAHAIMSELRRRGGLLAAELAESRRREVIGRSVLHAVGSGVVVYDARGAMVVANGSARELAQRGGYDLRRPHEPGDLVWSGAASAAIPAGDQALARAARLGHLSDTIEWLGPQHDLTPVGWSARRMHHDDGTELGTVVVCHDLTRVLAARRNQEQFLGTVSHELRTPLTSIVGFIDVAEQSVLPQSPEVLRRALDAIRRNADQLAGLVGDLLREAEEPARPHRQRVDLSELLVPVLDRWRTQCRDLGLHLDAELGSGVVADVDPHHVIRIAEALASNAMKFTAAGGEVRVRLSTGGEMVHLEITDTGIGMSEADRDRAFDRFHRGDAARVEAVQGIGLGLPTVKRLVEAHGGSVHLDSRPGAGTAVAVRLPATRRSTVAG